MSVTNSKLVEELSLIVYTNMELPHEIWVKVMIWGCVGAIAVILVLAVVQWRQQTRQIYVDNVLATADTTRRHRGKPRIKQDISWLRDCNSGFSGVTVPLMEITEV